MLNLLSASPQALATHLLQNRFQVCTLILKVCLFACFFFLQINKYHNVSFKKKNDTHATLQYLLEVMEQLPNVQQLTHQLLETDGAHLNNKCEQESHTVSADASREMMNDTFHSSTTVPNDNDNKNDRDTSFSVSSSAATTATAAADDITQRYMSPSLFALGTSLVPEWEVSSIIPRGKFTCTIHSNGIRLLQSKAFLTNINTKMTGGSAASSSLQSLYECIDILPSNVRYAIVFPTPEDCAKAVLASRKAPPPIPPSSSSTTTTKKKRKSSCINEEVDEDTDTINNNLLMTTMTASHTQYPTQKMLLLCFTSPIQSTMIPQGQDIITHATKHVTDGKRKSFTQVCFPLFNNNNKSKKDTTTTCTKLNKNHEQVVVEEEEIYISALKSLLSIPIFRISYPPSTTSCSFQFISEKEMNTSTTTSGMPFVKCHKGVQDGAIYPMEQGLLFYKLSFYIYSFIYMYRKYVYFFFNHGIYFFFFSHVSPLMISLYLLKYIYMYI